MDISVVLIIKNESDKLYDCLKSVQALQGEIVVVDSGSTDGSVDLARKFTDKVFIHEEWRGFGLQRQLAQSYASRSWILMIDADERLTPQLVEEIKGCIESGRYDAYQITRRNYFLNRELKFGGGVDEVLRLYRKDKGQCNDAEVHEKIIVEGTIGKLKHPMQHLSTDSLYTAINKMNTYSELGCANLKKKKSNVLLTSAIMHGLWTFFRIYLVQLGFLDGRAGFILAVLKAEGSYYKYVKFLIEKEARH